jgi:2-C-methyl-D-erythritol 4-phosphate cytidylyltransferase
MVSEGPERKAVAVVPAAGVGKRFATRGNKPLVELLGKPLLVWTLEALERHPDIIEIVPVIKVEDRKAAEAVIEHAGLTKVSVIAEGGPERQNSVLNGLRSISGNAALVLVHDAARPLITEDITSRVIEGIEGFDGAIAAVPPKDTIKEESANGNVARTLDRSRLWSVQTPQGFYRDILLKAHEHAARENYYATDDAALVERMKGRINIVMGSYENIKVTTPEDLDVAGLILKRRNEK